MNFKTFKSLKLSEISYFLIITMADISNPDPAEIPALGADAVRVTGAKGVLVWSSKPAPLHPSSESTELIISVHGWKW